MSARIIPTDRLPDYNALAATRRHPIPLAWHLMLQAGLRVGETRKLAWSDLIWQDEPKEALELDGSITKGGRPRTVPVSNKLAMEIITAWVNRAKPARLAPAHYALATKPNGRALCVRSIERAVAAIGHAAGGLTLTPHMLRHTFATRLLRVTNLRTVQLALGHARIGTTEIYTHPNQDDLRRAISQIP